MKKAMVIAAMWIMAAGNAFALTIPSGSVLTTGENGEQVVAEAHTTDSAQAQLDENGVFVGGGVLAVQIGDEVVVVDLIDLRGKSKDEIIEIIGEAAVEQLSDMYDDAEALVAEIEENGGSAFNAVGSTLEEEVDAILNDNHDAIVGGSQAAADFLVENSTSVDPVTGEVYNDTTHGEIQ